MMTKTKTIKMLLYHADELAIDRDRIGVTGDSAGGTLTARPA